MLSSLLSLSLSLSLPLPPSHLQPPAPTAGVDVPSGWFVEIVISDGMGQDSITISDPSITMATFDQNILKGTEYRARVRGSNSAGDGMFSGYITGETAVDRKLYHIWLNIQVYKVLLHS